MEGVFQAKTVVIDKATGEPVIDSTTGKPVVKMRNVALGEIRRAYLIDTARGVFAAIRRLRNMRTGDKNTFWDLSTGDNGAVICRSMYTSWEFVTPGATSISQSGTVADVIARIRAYAVATPPVAWDEFAVWISGGTVRSTINSYIDDGAATVVYDAQGNSYAGTQRNVPSCADFVDALDWMSSCFGAEFLAAAGSSVFTDARTVAFSIETTEDPVEGFGNVTLSFSFRF